MGDGCLHNSEPLNGTGCENFSKGIVAVLDMFNCSNYNEKNIEAKDSRQVLLMSRNKVLQRRSDKAG